MAFGLRQWTKQFHFSDNSCIWANVLSLLPLTENEDSNRVLLQIITVHVNSENTFRLWYVKNKLKKKKNTARLSIT